MSTKRTVIDLDSHIVEPRDAWSRYIEPKMREHALRIVDKHIEVHGIDGHQPYLVLGEQELYPVHVVAPIGLDRANEMAEAPQDGNEKARMATELRDALMPLEVISPKEGYDGPARLAWMDRAGVDRALVFPTWGLMWEQYVLDRPEVITANMSGYNRWLADFCAADTRRLVGVADLSLVDVAWAVAEVERAAKLGLGAVRLRPVLHAGKTLAHPDFDAFWDAVCDHHLPVTFHVDGSGTRGDTFFDEAWYLDENRGPAASTTMGSMPHVPAMLTLSNMFRLGTFAKRPSLRLGILELGAAWLGPYLDLADQTHKLGRANARFRARCPELPSTYAREQIWISPLEAEALPALLRSPLADRIGFSSDFPHPESSHQPADVWSEKIGDVGEARRQAFFHDVGASFLR